MFSASAEHSQLFLQRELPENINIRVGTQGVYPRVASLVANSIGKLDADEEELRQLALQHLHQLVEEEAALFRASLMQLSSYIAVPPEAQQALRGNVMKKASALQLNIHPPQEDTAEIRFALEALRQQVHSFTSLACRPF